MLDSQIKLTLFPESLGLSNLKKCFRLKLYILFKGFRGGSDSEESAYNVGDPVRIPELGRYPVEGNNVFTDEGTLFFFN